MAVLTPHGLVFDDRLSEILDAGVDLLVADFYL